MGGKHLPTTAWLVFFAVVDELSGVGAGRPELWAFLRDQCLACIKSTRDFSDIGDRVPLLEAMVCGVVLELYFLRTMSLQRYVGRAHSEKIESSVGGRHRSRPCFVLHVSPYTPQGYSEYVYLLGAMVLEGNGIGGYRSAMLCLD